MDFRDSPEELEFRREFRAWLAENAPREPIPVEPEARAHFLNAWHRKLYSAGYIGLSFPVEYGGRGLPPTFEAIYNDELGAAGAPSGPVFGHISNAVRLHGSDAQKKQHLPGLLSSEVRWCQGFSEPGAGSDLANLATRAEAIIVFVGVHPSITHTPPTRPRSMIAVRRPASSRAPANGLPA